MIAWIESIPPAEAGGELADAYKEAMTPHRTVDNVMQAHSLRVSLGELAIEVSGQQHFVELVVGHESPLLVGGWSGCKPSALTMMSRRLFRAVCRRDITVPIGIDRTSAASRYLSPWK